MAFELSWLLEGRVLYARLYGTVTEQDDDAADWLVEAFLNQSNGLPVHVVTDTTGIEQIQSDIKPSRDVEREHPLCKHPALGVRLSVSSARAPLFRYLSPFLSEAFKPSPLTFHSLDAGLAYLCQIDRSLSRGQFLKPATLHSRPA